MTTVAADTIRVFCKAKEVDSTYDATVAADLRVAELIDGLNEASYLPALANGERWNVVHQRSNNELTPNAKLNESGVEDGDQIDFIRATHGAEA